MPKATAKLLRCIITMHGGKKDRKPHYFKAVFIIKKIRFLKEMSNKFALFFLSVASKGNKVS